MSMNRKQSVLEFFKKNPGKWINNTQIVRDDVGGSEGMRRLRELQADGHDIRMRRLNKDTFQYMYSPPVERPAGVDRWVCPVCGEITASILTPAFDERYANGYCLTCRKDVTFKKLVV